MNTHRAPNRHGMSGGRFCLAHATAIDGAGVEKGIPPLRPMTVRYLRRWPCVLAVVAVMSFLVAASWAADLLPGAGPVPAERLIIQYRSGSFQLLSRSPVTKVLPPSDELPATNRAVSGFWFEVQTPKGEVKYRRIMPDPVTVYTEVPGPGPEPRPERAEVVPAETVFTVLVPRVPGSNNVVLFSSPPGAAGKAQAAQKVARIPLAEQPK
jgi:hypothetical protein